MVTCQDGSRRWCFFMTPSALASCGDWIPGTKIRMHPGVSHMIVVAEISKEIIEQVLRHLDTEGELSTHTLAVTDS